MRAGRCPLHPGTRLPPAFSDSGSGLCRQEAGQTDRQTDPGGALLCLPPPALALLLSLGSHGGFDGHDRDSRPGDLGAEGPA